MTRQEWVEKAKAYTQTDVDFVSENDNDYFLRALAMQDRGYVEAFIRARAPKIRHLAQKFCRQYQLSESHIEDLEQIFYLVLWEHLLQYDAADSVPLLTRVKYPVKEAWHQYVATSCRATVANPKQYSRLREAAFLYFSYEKEGHDSQDSVSYVAQQMQLKREKAEELCRVVLTWKDAEMLPWEQTEDDGFPFEKLEDVSTPSPYDRLQKEQQRQYVRDAVETLSAKERKLLSMTEGIDFSNYSEWKPTAYERIALLLGYADASAVQKNRKRILKKLRTALEKKGYA